MLRLRTATLATAWVIVGLGCTDVSEPPDVPPVSRALAALEGEELSTLQREWSVYAKQAPGFAGMFLDEQGNMVVRTVDMSEEQILRQAVQPAVQQFQQARPSGTRVQAADYSFSQLVRWHNAIRRDLRGTTGFTSIYIDYKDNQIGIGFAPEHEAGMRSASLAAARDNGVPEDAIFVYPIAFEVTIGHGPPPPATLRSHTVRHAHDPLLGGTRVLSEARDRPGQDDDGWCTMTLNVRWSFENPNQPMWLTNAHCSREIGETELDAWYQPTWSFGVVGYNAVDRLFGNPGNQYAWADVTMQYKNTFRTTPGGMGERGTAIGQIAWTEGPYPPTGSPQPGPLEINTSHEPRRVVGEGSVIEGRLVYKTGARTGTTLGLITRVDVTIQRGFEAQGGTWEQREQIQASYWSDFGDSGSPVYARGPAGSLQEVVIVGQNWGITDITLDREGIFSRWSGVRAMVEFGGSPICFTVSCQ